MEREDHKPLLVVLDESPSPSWSYHDNNTSVEEGNTLRWCLRKKPFDWKAPAIILGFEFFESIAFAGISLNLVVYLANVLHGSTASNAANVDTWNGTTFLAPVLGAFLADSYLGKYKTIFISVILYLLGMVTITASAMIPSLRPTTCTGTSCPAATEFQYAVFFIALYLIAIGTGGVKSALMPFGADQYDEANPDEAQMKQSFFSLFFVAINLGVFIAGTVVVWIQQNIAWALGFGISLASLVVAAVGFFVGTPIYRVQMPTGSPLKSVVRVLIVAFKKRHLELPKDSALLYEGEMGPGMERQYKLEHTDGFRCLDKAVIMAEPYSTDPGPATTWLSCTITQVEEVKILLRMVPIWLTCILYSASMCQTTTTFLQQGVRMNSMVGSLSIPAASLNSIEVIFMMIFVVIQDKIIIPICRRHFQNPSGLTQLQRMGIGRFLVIFSMVVAACLETWRLSCYKDKKSLSILWQVPQYLILAWSDVFCGIAQLEFFYTEAPQSMTSVCSAFSFLAISLGYYLNSFLVTFVASVTKVDGSGGWLPTDLNMGHLDYYFLLWAGISVVNFVVYVALSRKYTHKKAVFQ